MKPISFLILLFLTGQFLFAQNRVLDSLHAAFAKEQTDTGRILVLFNLSNAYQNTKPDSALLLAQDAYFRAKNVKFIKGESWALNQMAVAFNSLGNFPKALGYYIEQLKIEEKRDRPDNIAVVYLDIALLYKDARDFEKAIVYAKRADSIFTKENLEDLSLYSLLDIGEIYEKKNMLDSALLYNEKCYAKAFRAGNTLFIGSALTNLGNIYFKYGNFPKALNNYKASLPYLDSSGDYHIRVESMLGLAKLFEKTKQFDSAIYYAKNSFDVASGNQFIISALDASSFLTKLYKNLKNIDSSYAYQEIMVGIKDSIESIEKIKDVQNLTTEEQLRQKEIAQQKLFEMKDRQEKLQLLFIGITIPIFFLLSIYISRKKVHRRLIEFSGIISILMLFEYITLMLHPYIAEKTNHSPLIEIVIFVAIAAIITPSHHRIQHWLITKLTEYNYVRHHKPIPDQNENINEAAE
jgi:tetratricopeptide (TPR) repeat protein